MTILVSGATGLVGRYIVDGLLKGGYDILAGGRRPPPDDLFSRPVAFVPLVLDPDLDQTRAFTDVTAFVHAAFDHVQGRYRGGEGKDPDRFRRRNVDGTVKLFETAKRVGVQRAIFLSSRAVYDGLPAGTVLREDMPIAPTSLYGQIKLETEHALAEITDERFVTSCLRLTGVYGQLFPNKWDELFTDFLAGRPVTSRAGTEVHGQDVAAAVRLLLKADSGRVKGQSFNLSDLVVETRQIVAHLAPEGNDSRPDAADVSGLNLMATGKIRALGWRPGGRDLLEETLEQLAVRLTGSL